MNELEYIAYFKNLASQHGQIRHVDGERDAFYVVHDDNRTELEKALRNKLSLPALLLDQYVDDEDTESDNFRLKLHGGFSVVCKIEEAGDVLSIRQARHQARLIARSILNRIRRDARWPGGSLLEKHVFIDPASPGEMTPVLAGTTGWGYGFTWQMPISIAVDPADWLDL